MSNRINFTGQPRFPLSIETMDFLQTMIRHNAILNNIGGNIYILTGCEENGANVAPGYVVINGELLPFTGGIKQSNIYIKEVKRSVIASGYNFPDIYTTRTAEFGVGTPQYQWSAFKRIKTNFDLEALIVKLQQKVESLQSVPIGLRVGWVGFINKIPAGYLLCDGSVLSTNEYPELYDVIGNIYGGLPNLSFQLPLMGGRFVVGYNQYDSDYDTIGKTGGNKELILTIDQMPNHKHVIPWGENKRSIDQPPWGFATGYDSNNLHGSGDSDKDNSWLNTSDVGKGKPIDTRSPWFVEGYIIKAK